MGVGPREGETEVSRGDEKERERREKGKRRGRGRKQNTYLHPSAVGWRQPPFLTTFSSSQARRRRRRSDWGLDDLHLNDSARRCGAVTVGTLGWGVGLPGVGRFRDEI